MTGRGALLLLAVAGCGVVQTGVVQTGVVQTGVPDYAQLRPNAFGTGGDSDLAAATIANNAFTDAGRTYGRPAEGARAAAALEYMAGASSVSPRWQGVSDVTKEQLLAARAELRQALGVRPGARSQQVIDGLLAAASSLDSGNETAAAGALDRSGAFLAPGAEELNKLANLPYLRGANLATQHAADELQGNDTEFRHF